MKRENGETRRVFRVEIPGRYSQGPGRQGGCVWLMIWQQWVLERLRQWTELDGSISLLKVMGK